MGVTDKVIITCAITGAIHTPTMSPYLPITTDQIAAEAIAAANAGAAILHLHARDPATGKPDQTPEAFARFLPRIKQGTKAAINIATGGSPYMRVEERVRPAATLKPEVASLNVGSINFGLYHLLDKYKDFKFDWEKPHLEATRDLVFRNSFRDIEYILATCYGAGTRFGGDRRTWRLPEPIGSMALRSRGGAVVSLRSGFHLFDFVTGEVSRLNETQPGELRPRLNDGKVNWQGPIVAGSMDFEERDPVGKPFRLDSDFTLHTLDEGIICSNGPCWSLEGRTLYFADTGRRVVYAHDYDTTTGNVLSRCLFASFEKLRGLPDGATVDEEGYVRGVEVYSGRPIRFDPMGVIDRIVGLPVQSTTSLTFGGTDLDVVYVTSMARPMAGQYHREREAGCLFKIHGLGVRGLPEPRFAG